MNNLISWLSRAGDASGALGAVVSAMGCSMCFPALASLGAALGLGFLAQWEGLFINTLLPLFAGLALVANALGWLAHRQWRRSLLGMAGPVIVLLSLYPWFPYRWSTWTLYAGLALMMALAVYDLWSPAHRRCPAAGCADRTPNAPARATSGEQGS
ncbi:MAG TPA: organomercurial transporter MerC [Gammaproteobacteria bacterium]|nr:organomercurial transporter MerC [Gammaproteobacteria bacterium]